MASTEIYKRKQEWLDKVMSSKLSPATKVFAYGIFKRMYGDKIESFPDTNLLVEDTGLSRSKFTAHREALFSCGAMAGVKAREKGRFENFTYFINLEWNGHLNPAPSGNTVKDAPDTLEEATLHPLGTYPAPSGDNRAPSGCSNTSKNTLRKTTSKTTSAADAPLSSPSPSLSTNTSASSSLSTDDEVPLDRQDSNERPAPSGCMVESSTQKGLESLVETDLYKRIEKRVADLGKYLTSTEIEWAEKYCQVEFIDKGLPLDIDKAIDEASIW